MSAGHDVLPEGKEPPPRGWRAMAVVRWALVLVMALAAFGSLAAWFGWFDDPATTGEADAIWTCPMHPAIHEDHPGSCPICGMDLVRKETAAPPPAAGPGSVPGLVPVEIGAERAQLIGVKTAPVTRRSLSTTLRTVGTVVPTETGLAVVQTRVAGWIEELRVAETGRRVKKGDVLATIYSPELLAAQEQYLSALRWAADDKAVSADLATDTRRRLELLGVAAADLDALAKSGRAMRAVPVRAAASGHVVEKTVIAGQYVQPGTTLFALANLSTVWVIADVYERDLARVSAGQEATFRPASDGGAEIRGKIDLVYPSVDAATRTARARLRIANRDLRLRPGMYGDVELAAPGVSALTIPAEALVDTGEHQYVFLARPGGRFEPRLVRAGAREGGEVHILDGVAEGDVVVTTANFLLDSESRLQGAMTPATGHEGH